MRITDENRIVLNDGRIVQLPKSGNMKLSIYQNNGREKVFCNCKEFKDGEFKVTFAAIFHYLFG